MSKRETPKYNVGQKVVIKGSYNRYEGRRPDQIATIEDIYEHPEHGSLQYCMDSGEWFYVNDIIGLAK